MSNDTYRVIFHFCKSNEKTVEEQQTIESETPIFCDFKKNEVVNVCRDYQDVHRDFAIKVYRVFFTDYTFSFLPDGKRLFCSNVYLKN